MAIKNNFTLTLPRLDGANELSQLPVAVDIARDKLVGKVFVNSADNNVYECINVRYVRANVTYFTLEYIFECAYKQVPVVRFTDFSTTCKFNGLPMEERNILGRNYPND